ncbi:membrane-spanning 4-domains subfamily A member 8-like, partial [Varanus komodoensis]|uniref:membrane-spanning 4-domains subfamily A member 8-like n=1 Tax=Varanus komodoensis TaxID=61221 RepID=UPI001CF7E54B
STGINQTLPIFLNFQVSFSVVTFFSRKGNCLSSFLCIFFPQAIQIVIALVHIGFASVSIVLFNHRYVLLTTISGYPFWGSIFFIISGSLSVSAEKHLTPGLVRCSVAMNIVSTIMSFTGIILYVVELAISSLINYPSDLHGYDLKESLNTGLSVLLFLFSLLEFCITVSTAHFGCQAACCNSDGEVVFVPYAVSGGHMVLTEGSASPLPPIYQAVSPREKP